LRPIVGAVIVIAIVALAIALLTRGQDNVVAASPGSARLVIADFGEGANYAATALGKTTAETMRREVQSGLGAAAAGMPTLSAGVIRDASAAAREMRRQGAQALLWGTLPAGANGTISATLAWQGSPPPAPWLRYGPPGRLLLPPSVPLPDQPLIAAKSLAPLLEAIQIYHAGDYAGALARAHAVPADAPASALNLSYFVSANCLIALDRPAEALPIYQALEARGWGGAALYNNWALAAAQSGDAAGALARLDQAAQAAPADQPAMLATIYTNRGIAAEDTGDFAAAGAAFDRALQADPQAPEANWRRGYLAYREGDSVTASAYTERALALQPDNPEIQRQAGLIALMDRQQAAAIDHLTRALQVYTGWVGTLRKDEGAALSGNDMSTAARITNRLRVLNQESGTTQYYIGLAYADNARTQPPEGFLASAWRFVTRGQTDTDRAIAAFQDAIRLDRDRPDVRYQMGVLYWHTGNRNGARDQFAQAKALQADLPAPYEALAAMDLEDKHPDQAVAEYQALITANPSYLPAYLALADLYSKTGDSASATTTYQRAVAVPAQTPRQHYLRGEALAALNRDAEAADEARAALTADPSQAAAHGLLARLYQRSGQDDAALAEYENELKAQPDNADALYQSGVLLAAHGRTDDAAARWVRITQIQPDYADAHFALGGLYEQKAALARQQGKPTDAARWTDQALQEYNTAVEQKAGRADGYYHLGRLYAQKGAWKDAEKNYAAAVRQDPNIVEAWQGLVASLLKQPGRDGDALKQAQAFRQYAPRDPRAYLLLGDVLLYRNDPSAAIGQYEQALKLQPGLPEALLGEGAAYHQQGDLDRALQYYDAALKAQPNSAAAITGEGDVYLDRGLNGQAQDAYNLALQADPNYAPAWTGLGRVLDRMNQGVEARKKLVHASELDPTAAEPHFYLGETYGSRAVWDEAAHEYTVAASLRPAWAMPQFRLGQVYLAQRKLPEALRAYHEAVRLDPNMLEAWFGLGQASRDSGDRKTAISSYREAIRLKNDYAAAWLYLGYTLEEDGQRTEAADAFRHAADTATDDATIRAAAQEALRRFQ
jgi:tetratricopeptide (TPR) repeat protein